MSLERVAAAVMAVLVGARRRMLALLVERALKASQTGDPTRTGLLARSAEVSQMQGTRTLHHRLDRRVV